MPLNQGATVFAGDRIRIVVNMTGKDPITKQVVNTPIPADAIVNWSKRLMTPGSVVAFETAAQRFDAIIDSVGGPGEITVFVDKVSQTADGRFFINFACRDPRTGQEYNATGQCSLTTTPGERPMVDNPTPTPVPTPTGAVPQNVSFTMELLPRTKPTGK